MPQQQKMTKNKEEVKPSCRVDAKPPLLLLSAVRRPDQMGHLQAATKALDLLNFAYFQALLTIHIKGGLVNSFRTKPVPKGFSKKRIMALARKTLREQNKSLRESLATVKPAVPTCADLHTEWMRRKKKIHCYRNFHRDLVASEPPSPDIVQYFTEKSRKYADKRPRVRIEVSVRGERHLGHMTVMLYSDYAPILCENFLRYINGWQERFPNGCTIYRIFPTFFFITGLEDSLARSVFNQDQFNPLQHAEPGVLSIYNVSPKINGSQLVISFSKRVAFDGHYFPFGKVVGLRGIKTLRQIENEGTKLSGYPKAPLYISNVEEI